MVYGLLVLQSGIPQGEEAFTLIAVCIAFSIVAHSSTDVPIARSSTSTTSPESRPHARTPTHSPRKARPMHAHELAGPYPTVSAAADALDAARLLVREQLPALLVLDRDDYPYAVVPSARVISALLPWYMREGPIPAAGVDDHFDEEAREAMTGRSVTMGVPLLE